MIKVEKWYAPWCSPCKNIAPELDALHAMGDIELTSFNIDENMEAAQARGVRGIPTLIVVDDEGKEVERFNTLLRFKKWLAEQEGAQ